MKMCSDLKLQAKERNKYKNEELRFIFISDGEYCCGINEIAIFLNNIIKNKIRVESVIFTAEITRDLVLISR